MDDTEKEMRVSRGLGALLANIGGGNIGVNSSDTQKTLPKVEVPKPPPQENEGFDLNSVEEFTGWGDLNPGSNANSDTSHSSNQRTDSSRRGRNFGANNKKHRKAKPQDNQLSGANCEPLTARSNYNQGRDGGNTGRNFNSSYNNHRRDGGNRDVGFKRESSQGQTDDFKRRRSDHDEDVYGPKDVTSWTDILEYDDEPDTEWFNEENKRLAEEYGSFVTVKYIESQPGKVGYYCELCYAEMNARKSLELHCGGMKHLKKKNLWEKNKGAAAKKETQSSDNQSSFGSQYGEGGEMDRFNRFGQSGGPYNGAASQKSSTPQEKLAGGPTGTLIKRLAECSVKHQDDAQLASDVITLLLKSLKEYHQRRGYGETARLLDESEVKFNIIKALQNNPQAGRMNSDPGSQQNYSSQYYPPPGGSNNYPPSGGSNNYPPSGGSNNYPPSGGSNNYPPSGGSNNYPPSGSSNNYPPSGGSNNYPPSGGSNNYPPSGGSNNFQPPGGSNNYPPSGGSNSYPPSGGSNNFQPPGGPNNYQSSGGSNNYHPPGGSNNFQSSGGPNNYHPPGGSSIFPPIGGSSNFHPPGGSPNYPPPGAPTNYPPPGGSTNFPPPGGSANYPPPGGPNNYQQGGGQGPIPYNAPQYNSNNYSSRMQ
ncbi:uncharacterized protein [Panulirus ornatus]|uniref:uncharacterized protein isoform X2 n=1 Tax=Panulirus ornatus TaxID=150431 RepID=UPI003A8A2CEB